MQERDFLLPSTKRAQSSIACLPKGSLPARNSILGGLDLIRALLRLHEAVSTVASQLDSSENGEKWDGTPPTPDGDTRSAQADRVKTAINNLLNLVIFGCLVPELGNSTHGSENNITSSGGMFLFTKYTTPLSVRHDSIPLVVIMLTIFQHSENFSEQVYPK